MLPDSQLKSAPKGNRRSEFYVYWLSGFVLFLFFTLKLLTMKTSKQRKMAAAVVLLSATAILLSSCADVTLIQDCVHAKPYGFLGGLWHGFIAPLSFIGSLISDTIAMYAVNNTGGWYDFGFVLGAGILFGGGSRAGC